MSESLRFLKQQPEDIIIGSNHDLKRELKYSNGYLIPTLKILVNLLTYKKFYSLVANTSLCLVREHTTVENYLNTKYTK